MSEGEDTRRRYPFETREDLIAAMRAESEDGVLPNLLIWNERVASPTSRTLTKTFGAWPDACAAAGLKSAMQVKRERREAAAARARAERPEPTGPERRSTTTARRKVQQRKIREAAEGVAPEGKRTRERRETREEVMQKLREQQQDGTLRVRKASPEEFARMRAEAQAARERVLSDPEARRRDRALRAHEEMAAHLPNDPDREQPEPANELEAVA